MMRLEMKRIVTAPASFPNAKSSAQSQALTRFSD
jgi:hypothetical protein